MDDTYILRWIEKETDKEHEETFRSVFGRTHRQEEIDNISKEGHCFINHNDGTLPEYQYSFFNR